MLAFEGLPSAAEATISPQLWPLVAISNHWPATIGTDRHRIRQWLGGHWYRSVLMTTNVGRQWEKSELTLYDADRYRWSQIVASGGDW